MKISRVIRKTTAAVLAASMLSGCMTTGPLHEGFYPSPAPLETKVPVKVAVILDGAPKEIINTSPGPSQEGVVELGEYPKAVVRMLGSLYSEVSVSSTAAQAGDVDYIVSLKPATPGQMTLTFTDARGARTLGSYTRPGLESSADSIGVGSIVFDFFAVILSAGINFIVLNSEADRLFKEREASASESIAVGLASIHDQLERNDILMHTPAQNKALADWETRADQESDVAQALQDYLRATTGYLPGGDNALRVEAKAAAATARGGERPPVPEEAKDFMMKGKAGVARATSPADYVPASRSMEQAVAAAPWWASGHFNAALAEEQAGLWSPAAKHLKIYLTLSPDAEDREKVRFKIAELELHQEHSDSPAGE